MSALTPLDQVIRQLCLETGDRQFKNYDTVLGHVRGALIDLNLFVIPSVKSQVIIADHLGNLKWPCSCVKPLIITLIRNEQRCVLSVNSDIANNRKSSCTTLHEAEKIMSEYCTSPGLGTDIYYRDGNGNELRGAGFDHLNMCHHNKENRITNINARILKGDKYEITFQSAGVDEVTHVPVEAETCIGEWFFWKYYRRTDKGTSDRSRGNYKEESYRLSQLYITTSKQDWINAIVNV